MNIKWLCAIVGAMLLLAIPQGWPYSYYQILRWVVFLSSIYCVSAFYKQKINIGVLIFSIMALVFNPVFPIFLNKSSWMVIDLISSLFFFLVAGKVKKKQNDKHYE